MTKKSQPSPSTSLLVMLVPHLADLNDPQHSPFVNDEQLGTDLLSRGSCHPSGGDRPVMKSPS